MIQGINEQCKNTGKQNALMFFNIGIFSGENKQSKMAMSAATTYTFIFVMPVFRSVIRGILIELKGAIRATVLPEAAGKR